MERQFWGKVGSVAAIVATLQFFHQIGWPHGGAARKSETAPMGTSIALAVPQRARLVRIPDDAAEQLEIEAPRMNASFGGVAALVLVGFAGALWFATRGRLCLQTR